MSVSQKDYYFLTNRTTFFRYFVDNSSGKAIKHIFYPLQYETMTSNQINKYERKLTLNFLRWAPFNKHKMLTNDYQIATSKLIDVGTYLVCGLLLARFSRIFLFRHEFFKVQSFLETNNLDVKFWKTIFAYSFSFGAAYSLAKRSLNSFNLVDLAVEYSSNFSDELQMPEIQTQLKGFYSKRFPWLNKQN